MPRHRDIGTDDPRVKVRPSKSKPRRSKKTVDYSQTPIGYVYSIDRGRYHVWVNDTRVVAVKARELGRHGIVVGDSVRLDGDISGRKDTLARIVLIEDRKTVLTRSVEDSPGAKEKPMVANAQQLAIVTACADPAPKIGMIDRCLVAAYAAGMEPILVLTKADLDTAQEILDLYQPLGLKCIKCSAVTELGKAEVEGIFAGKSTVLIGHSGVGKSSLMNLLIPEAEREVGQVNEVTGKGRHVSTSLMALSYHGGWLIDTPGIRAFGLAHVTQDQVLAAFFELQTVAQRCPKGCQHLADTPGCVLDHWAQNIPERITRIRSLRRLFESQKEKHLQEKAS